MKHIFLVFGLLIMAAVGVSWAATTPTTPTIRQILVECPDWDHAQACPSAIRDFVAGRVPSTDQTDRQMGSLAVKLVQALQSGDDAYVTAQLRPDLRPAGAQMLPKRLTRRAL